VDANEEELYRAIDSDDHEIGRHILTPERKVELQLRREEPSPSSGGFDSSISIDIVWHLPYMCA
jgi:hypothetical protein